MRWLPFSLSLGAMGLALALGCSPAQLVGPPPPDDAGTTDGPGPPPMDGSLPTTTSVSIIVEPSDKGAAILAAINAAKKSIHVTMYLFTNDTLADALIAQHKAGRDVKIILNANFPSAGADNAQEYAKFKAAGIPVIFAPSKFTYTHEKSVLIDGTTAWIMTMNLTFTSPTDNREFLAIDSDPYDIAEAEEIFAADFANREAVLTGRLVVAPVNARDKLVRMMNEATKTIDLEGESFSDQGIEDALVAAKKRGLAVRVLLSDQTPSSAMAKSVADLKTAGIPVRKLATPYIHSKAIVADGAVAYVGSENFTLNSLDNNRELGVLVSDPASVKIVGDTINADFNKGVVY